MKVTPEEAHANDTKLRQQYGDILCGIDEVGRGSWAGPLVVGAVVLPKDVIIPKLTDSKQLSASLRESLAEEIKRVALAWTVYQIEAMSIDRKGLTWANSTASYEAGKIIQQSMNVDLFVLDQMPECGLTPNVMMAKADSLSHVVAAASCIAKTYRDNLMSELSDEHPEYHFDAHKGYVSPVHKIAVRQHGRIRGVHRYSYKVDGINPDAGRGDLLRRKQ